MYTTLAHFIAVWLKVVDTVVEMFEIKPFAIASTD